MIITITATSHGPWPDIRTSNSKWIGMRLLLTHFIIIIVWIQLSKSSLWNWRASSALTFNSCTPTSSESAGFSTEMSSQSRSGNVRITNYELNWFSRENWRCRRHVYSILALVTVGASMRLKQKEATLTNIAHCSRDGFSMPCRYRLRSEFQTVASDNHIRSAYIELTEKTIYV